MPSSLAIGDFAQATHLSIKTLRHYHRVGLLAPAAVDPDTGHRRYTTDQIPTAQVIRRFRSLDMPLGDIRAVLAAPDFKTRNDLIASHLGRLEDSLARTQQAAASLRDLLQPNRAATAAVEHRNVDAAPAAAVREVIDIADASPWYQGAMGELYATLAAQKITPAGPAGGIFTSELFTRERGAATVFVPCSPAPRQTGRVEPVVVPGAELAFILHPGTPADIDKAYGALATYVADHALAVDGPIREYYLVGSHDTADETKWRTEIGWPIFRTGQLS
jgi:DNA-binding transcriptional MerR regulator